MTKQKHMVGLLAVYLKKKFVYRWKLKHNSYNICNHPYIMRRKDLVKFQFDLV